MDKETRLNSAEKRKLDKLARTGASPAPRVPKEPSSPAVQVREEPNETKPIGGAKPAAKKKTKLIVAVTAVVLIALTVFLLIWFLVVKKDRNEATVTVSYTETSVSCVWDATEGATVYMVEYYFRDKSATVSLSTDVASVTVDRGYGDFYVRVKPIGEGIPGDYWTAWYKQSIPPKPCSFNSQLVKICVSKDGVVNFYLYWDNMVVDGTSVNTYTVTNAIGDGAVQRTSYENEEIAGFDVNDDEELHAAIDAGKLYQVSFSPLVSGKTQGIFTITPDFSTQEELLEKYVGKTVTFKVTFNWDKKNSTRAGTFVLSSNDITVPSAEEDIEIW